MAPYKRATKRIIHGCSFVKSAGSESLKLLSRNERMSEEQRERFTLGHKRGKLSKTYEKYEFVERIARFLQAIRSNL